MTTDEDKAVSPGADKTSPDSLAALKAVIDPVLSIFLQNYAGRSTSAMPWEKIK